jgi:hypothetical protein
VRDETYLFVQSCFLPSRRKPVFLFPSCSCSAVDIMLLSLDIDLLITDIQVKPHVALSYTMVCLLKCDEICGAMACH